MAIRKRKCTKSIATAAGQGDNKKGGAGTEDTRASVAERNTLNFRRVQWPMRNHNSHERVVAV